MKFYNREQELLKLEQIRQVAFDLHSQMTVVTGRRRIGKTKLILKSCADTPTVYLFVSRNNEATLCELFAESIRRDLNVPFPSGINSFVDLFAQIMLLGRIMKFNLVIDEFQELYNVNPSIFSGIQNYWDQYKDSTHINFIASGSVYTLMHRIFMDYKEPLYGRCDTVMRIRPFNTAVLRQIMTDYAPQHTNDDLLCLFTITGGVPKYVEILMDRGAYTVADMIRLVSEDNSIFLEEGNILLSQEFGKKYGNYYSIMSSIAAGRNTAAEIAAAVGDMSVGGMLSRLEEDYELIRKSRPLLAKERTQNVRYEIADNFLRFWFRYIARNQALIQMEQFTYLSQVILDDYPTYSGLLLEEWFRLQMKESGQYLQIGSWWNNARGSNVNQSEIDIVAIRLQPPKTAVAVEVKRQGKNFKPQAFEAKIEQLKVKAMHDYTIEPRLLTLDDM